MRPIAAIASLCFCVTGCTGIDEALPEGDDDSGPSRSPGADVLEGTDNGVGFAYRGGTVTVDLSGAPADLRDRLIGGRIVVDCGGADQSRRWPPRAGEELTIQLTREGATPADVPVEISSCRIEPVPGPPVASARMRDATA